MTSEKQIARLTKKVENLMDELAHVRSLLKQSQKELVKAQTAMADIRPHAVAIADLAGNPRKS